MSEELDDIEQVDDTQLSMELQVFVGCLAELEHADLNLFPRDKQDIQMKLIKLVKQRLDFLDFEEDWNTNKTTRKDIYTRKKDKNRDSQFAKWEQRKKEMI